MEGLHLPIAKSVVKFYMVSENLPEYVQQWTGKARAKIIDFYCSFVQGLRILIKPLVPLARFVW